MSMTPKELGAYLKNIRESLGYSTYDVNKLCDISQSYLSLLENGKRRASAIVLKKLAPIYNVSYIELYEKAGYIELIEADEWDKLNKSSYNKTFHDDNSVSYSIPKATSNVFPIPDTPIKVPVLGKISAGLPILAVENIEGYEYAPSSYIKKGFDYFYLRVTGDSMNLKFNDGDIVLVQQQDTLENGEIGVILVNGNDATVKKFREENNIVILEPMSTNSEHHVQIYNPKEISIKILGKVVSYQGKL